jgi:hypothetical protein
VCLFAERLEDGNFRWPNLQDGVLRGGLWRLRGVPSKHALASCKRDHAGPPLGSGADIDVILARESEFAICSHPEHGQAGR